MTTIPHSGPRLNDDPGDHHPGDDRAGEPEANDAVAISPFYYSSVNEITQPNSYTASSHYLTRRWKRDLGPTGYAILTSFRDRCFYNRKTGELRDVIQVPVTEIADECGISEKTVRRELAANRALQKFVRAQREPVPDVRRGGWRWGPNTFQVAMDDPIHPDDEPELLAIVRRKAEEADKAPEDPLARARRLAAGSQKPAETPQKTAPSGGKPALGQNDRTKAEAPPQRSDRLTERADNLTTEADKLADPPGQIDRTLKNPDSSLPEQTLPDAAGAAPEFSLSLFSGEEKEGLSVGVTLAPTEPPARRQPRPWPQLTDAEQEPYFVQSRRELEAIHAGTGISPKPKLIEVRARNLYEMEGRKG